MPSENFFPVRAVEQGTERGSRRASNAYRLARHQFSRSHLGLLRGALRAGAHIRDRFTSTKRAARQRNSAGMDSVSRPTSAAPLKGGDGVREGGGGGGSSAPETVCVQSRRRENGTEGAEGERAQRGGGVQGVRRAGNQRLCVRCAGCRHHACSGGRLR